MNDRAMNRRGLLVPMAVEAVHRCVVGVVDHILHGFAWDGWICGQAGCIVAGPAVVGMAAQDILPVEDRMAGGAWPGIGLSNIGSHIDLHAMVYDAATAAVIMAVKGAGMTIFALAAAESGRTDAESGGG